MTIEEQIREIVLSKELSNSEKLDQLHALIPPDACKIDNLNKATPAQLKQLKAGLALTKAMQQLRRRTTRKRNRAKPSALKQTNARFTAARVRFFLPSSPGERSSSGSRASGHCPKRESCDDQKDRYQSA
jgi:hypothetical protein